jgi:hypothetical protein
MTAFLVIGGVGLTLLIVSFVLGEFLHGVFGAFDSDFLSASAIAGFAAALGFVGALVMPYAGAGAAILAGLVAGIGVGIGVGALTRVLSNGAGDVTVRSADLAGLTGTVITEIPPGGYGQVSVTISGHITLPAGTPVTVSSVLSPTSVQVTRRQTALATGDDDPSGWPWGHR